MVDYHKDAFGNDIVIGKKYAYVYMCGSSLEQRKVRAIQLTPKRVRVPTRIFRKDSDGCWKYIENPDLTFTDTIPAHRMFPYPEDQQDETVD